MIFSIGFSYVIILILKINFLFFLKTFTDCLLVLATLLQRTLYNWLQQSESVVDWDTIFVSSDKTVEPLLLQVEQADAA